MKRTFLILCIISLVVTCNNLMAQDDKTSYDRSRKISDQLKSGAAPGLKFGPASQKRSTLKEPTAAEKSASVGKQLKSGNLPGASVAKGGGGGGSVNRNAINSKRSAAGQKLPSDLAAGQQLKTTPAATGNPKEPAQGGVAQPDLHVVPKAARKAAPVATPASAPANTPDKTKLKRN